MRVRADQVRAGQRISGATVTKVRQTLERGTVRLTLENEDRPEVHVGPGALSPMGGAMGAPVGGPVGGSVGVADGTFCYRSGDLLDVEGPRP